MSPGSESGQSPVSQLLVEAVDDLLREAHAQYQRRALVLSGARDWCMAAAGRLLNGTGLAAVHWFSDCAPAGTARSQGAAAFSLLGSELDALVFDAWSGFDPDAFGALSGTLKGGGLLLLLTPPLDQWSAYPDPQNQRITVAPHAPESLSGRFVTRLVRVLQSDPGVMICEAGVLTKTPRQHSAPAPVENHIEPPCITRDQQRAVAAVIRVVTGHRRRPVVLTSDRGRGKSAAFGIAAAELIQSGRKRILLTGPGAQSVAAVTEQVRRLAPDDAKAMRFVAPDALLREPQAADLLLIDEAAAIPAPLLETLLRRYSRIAFATTVHGYEGTGRGFALRFSRVLDQHSNGWKSLQLVTPVRWAENDPLERLVFRMLLLDANATSDEILRDANPDECLIERLQRDELHTDEQTLSELFGLLVQAHYRTRPLDLRHLLDGPNLSVYVARINRHVAATALVAEEGGFDAQTAQAIWAGKLRPHGHLLPETLAAHQGLAAAPQLRCARIMRITVHPLVQRRGLGTRLVEHITRQVRGAGCDYIGSSFAATTDLLEFWRRLGWRPARLSIQRGASSGSHSVVMLNPLTEAGEDLVATAGERFYAQFPHQLSDSLRDLEAGLVCGLMRNAATETPRPDEADWRDVRAFAFERRLAEVSIGALWRFACHVLMRPGGVSGLNEKELTLLVARILQKRSWADCAHSIDVPGRAQALSVLRTAVTKLIS